MNLQEIMDLGDPIKTIDQHINKLNDYESNECNSRKTITITQEQVDEVIELHKRMGHQSSAVMAKSIRDCALTNVDIEYQLIERVKQIDCPACVLAKRNKLPILSGSGLVPSQFGHTISLDREVRISPLAKGGYDGFYLFRERTIGYCHAFLVKDYDLVKYIKLVVNE